jgi:hypothetical protein
LQQKQEEALLKDKKFLKYGSKEQAVPEIDPTMYVRTFRVGRKTIIKELLASAADFWGFNPRLAILYTVEEDGTLIDL